ncbi:hypothetical protein QRO11_12190 [Paracidovorax citrulli]|uniref:hypothetical protein n=1 Tax=Paracidovorax citrulli TaxID=80869 RepID=UPI0005FB462A|nr:hypothetical protein [Paracidovorax citrulli]UMT88349.1 hypothetical protein FRC90_09890 [Paracidovorax citrulli]WIY32744.1 hypothetical protein QRO11_12190 [Paracidovorax citrulli]SDJ32458.1 hypothetical protein SAMN04489709_103103 [Paracidovorax citrulli]
MIRDNRPLQADIREWLRQQPDGATVAEVVNITGRDRVTVARALEAMADACVDRWAPCSGPSRFERVWCIAPVPEDCPRPDTEVAA